MAKAPDWLMLIIVLGIGIFTIYQAHTSIEISNNSLILANQSLQISENALKVSENVYTILELEKSPKVIASKEPDCYNNFNTYRDIELGLRNIGGLDTKCKIKIVSSGFNCLSPSDDFDLDKYLRKNIDDDSVWIGRKPYYKSEFYEEFIELQAKFGNQVCEEELLLDGEGIGFVKFKIYMSPNIKDNATAKFKIKYSCENPIFKKSEEVELPECKYRIGRPYKEEILFSTFTNLIS